MCSICSCSGFRVQGGYKFNVDPGLLETRSSEGLAAALLLGSRLYAVLRSRGFHNQPNTWVCIIAHGISHPGSAKYVCHTVRPNTVVFGPYTLYYTPTVTLTVSYLTTRQTVSYLTTRQTNRYNSPKPTALNPHFKKQGIFNPKNTHISQPF